MLQKNFYFSDTEAVKGYDQNYNYVSNLSPFRNKMSHRSPVVDEI